jgi:hypothetical protein
LSIAYTVPIRGSNIADAENAGTPSAPGPKVRNPDTFSGQRTELKKFLLQCDLYLELCKKDFDNKTDKVYFAIALLKGAAADWAEPYTRQKLDKTPTEQSLETRTIFANFDTFKQAMVSMFGDLAKDRRAAGELLLLRQTGSVIGYTAKFQQLYAKAGWDDKASVDQFYRGLNNRIKDQISLSMQDRPTMLQAMIRLTSDIWDRLQERVLEKKEGPYSLSR